MGRGVTVFRRLEEERLNQLSSVSRLFLSIMMTNRPKMMNLTERLKEPVDLCDVNRDIENLSKYDAADPEGDMGIQMLPHFYAEDLVNVMNKERRREALEETPKFGGEESQQDVQEKLQHMRSMMTYL